MMRELLILPFQAITRSMPVDRSDSQSLEPAVVIIPVSVVNIIKFHQRLRMNRRNLFKGLPLIPKPVVSNVSATILE